MENPELSKIAELRSRTYWFLSEIFMEKPDVDFLKNLKENVKNIIDIVDSDTLKDQFEILEAYLNENDLNELEHRLGI